MKLLKYCWYGLMASSLLAGLITGRREFYLLLFIMAFVPFFSLCLNLWAARSFCYIHEVDRKACVKGDRTSMRVAITNDKPFPFPLIRLTMATVARSRAAYERFSLLPSSRITFTVPMSCPYRGVYGVGITALEIHDSFGLVKTTFNMLELSYYRHIEVKVYPKLTELNALPAGGIDSKKNGNAGIWRAEYGESYAGLRPYRPGDPFKRVHRAVSSRMREWYVRTYDLPLETSVLIMLDTAAACENEEERLYLGDLVCECAAAIARYSLKNGYRVTYIDALLHSPLVLKTLGDFAKLYDRLAELEFEAYDGNPRAFPQLAAGLFHSAQAAYAISARGSDGIRKALSSSDASRIDIKLIAVRSGASAPQGPKPCYPAISGVHAIPVAVGDDVAAVLAL